MSLSLVDILFYVQICSEEYVVAAATNVQGGQVAVNVSMAGLALKCAAESRTINADRWGTSTQNCQSSSLPRPQKRTYLLCTTPYSKGRRSQHSKRKLPGLELQIARVWNFHDLSQGHIPLFCKLTIAEIISVPSYCWTCQGMKALGNVHPFCCQTSKQKAPNLSSKS